MPLYYVEGISNCFSAEPLNKALFEALINSQILIAQESMDENSDYNIEEESIIEDYEDSTKTHTRKRKANAVFIPDNSKMRIRYFSNFPMVTPPVDWTKTETGQIQGGYLSTNITSVLRFNAISSKDYQQKLVSLAS